MFFFLAGLSGILLTLMIHTTGVLASYTSALAASLILHALASTSSFIGLLFSSRKPQSEAPRWYYYLGGTLGAFIVMFHNIVVNSPLGMASLIAFTLLGQMVGSVLIDHFGFFALPRRSMTKKQWQQMALFFGGSLLILYGTV